MNLVATHYISCTTLQLHITYGLHLPSFTALTHSHPPLHQSHSCHQSLINPDCLDPDWLLTYCGCLRGGTRRVRSRGRSVPGARRVRSPAGPAQLSFVSAGPAQLSFVSAGPAQLSFVSAGPAQLSFVSAGPAQLSFVSAGPAQLSFVSAGPAQLAFSVDSV